MSNLASEACCTIPPISSDYSPKGTEGSVAGYKTYEIGTGDQVVIFVYDIFGYWPTTKQGADSIALAGLKVVMPDFFRGEPFPSEAYDDPEKRKNVGGFIQTKGNPAATAQAIRNIAKELKSKGAKSVGVVGLCWGGKVATLAGSDASALDAVSSIHPAFVDAKDVETLAVPIAFFPSKDEDPAAVEKFWKAVEEKTSIGQKSVFNLYKTVHHGFAGARAKPNDEENIKQFSDVYSRLGSCTSPGLPFLKSRRFFSSPFVEVRS